MGEVRASGFVSLPVLDIGARPFGTIAVYALTDPRDDLVRYVGITRGSLESRLMRHLWNPTNEATANWFSELASTGLRPTVVPLAYVPASGPDWQRAERWWISWFRERGELLNIQAGGEVTRSRTRKPDKTYPLRPDELPTNKRNPYGRFAVWDRETDRWIKVVLADDGVLARGVLDPRYPHDATCSCRKCLLLTG